jgi:hypothetical protein
MDDFDIPNVPRYDSYDVLGCDNYQSGHYVNASDYDKLMQKYIQALINFNACTLRLAAMKG